MRRFAAATVALGVIAGFAAHPVAAATHRTRATAVSSLRKTLASALNSVGGATGAYVLDLSTGQALFSSAPDTGRLPASVEKLYTTSTALLRFGPAATLSTSVLGTGTLDSRGTWSGTLYLRGGGDPTFGSASFDDSAYGTGATVQRLVATLIHGSGIRAVRGRIVGDESYFDSLRGTPPSGYQFSPWVEGALSALVFNRGLINQSADYVTHPAVYAAQQLASALRSAGTHVPSSTPVSAGVTPAGSTRLATVSSPTIATLAELTNTPSDNFLAEMLLKGLGARFGGRGSTAAGASIVRSELASSFGIAPRLDDGSGLSRDDSTSPRQVVTLLAQLAIVPAFVSSLAVAGRTGTLQHAMQGTRAQDHCQGKTGTLHDVASLVGYCEARDKHRLAFAFLMNSVDPNVGHATEDQMAVALASYNG